MGVWKVLAMEGKERGNILRGQKTLMGGGWKRREEKKSKNKMENGKNRE